MNILFTWKYRKELLRVDCKLTKNKYDSYDTSIKVHKEDKAIKCLYQFDILNIIGQQEYKVLHGAPDHEMLQDIADVILEQIDIIRPCHLN